MTPLRLAVIDLWRRKTSTIAALIVIATSVLVGGVLMRVYVLSQSRFSTMAVQADAIIGAKAGGIEILLNCLNLEGPYPDFVPVALFNTLRSDDPVRVGDRPMLPSAFIEQVIPILFCARFKDYRVMGTDDSFFARSRPGEAPVFALGAWSQDTGTVVVGAEVARRERVTVGDTIFATSWAGDGRGSMQPSIAYVVTGVLQPSGTVWDAALFTNLYDAQGAIAATGALAGGTWSQQVLHYFLVYLKPDGFRSLRTLINERTVAQAVSVPDELARLKEISGSGEKLGLLIMGLVLALGGLSVVSMMIPRFEALKIQMAILRALGYDLYFLARWLLWEGLLLGAAASCVGAGGGLIAFPYILTMMGRALPDMPLVDPSFVVGAWVWLAAIGSTVLAMLVPLYRLTRDDVHQSLRGL